MSHLIVLNRADNNSSSSAELSSEITINADMVIMIEDFEGRSEGESKILFKNGKTLIVMESQSDIRDLVNDDKQENSEAPQGRSLF